MAITNYLVHFTTEATYNNKKSELRNDAVAFVKDATIIHTHGTDYYCGSGPVALKSDLSGYATTSALTSGLAGKANTSHTHTISQVSGLQDELDSKLESADLSKYALKTDIPSLSGGASATFGQYVSGVTVSGHEVTVTKAALPVTTLSSLGITATAAELNYVDGVTSNIQTQLNSKANSSALSNYLPLSGNEDGPYFTGNVQIGDQSLYFGANYIQGSGNGLTLYDLNGFTDVSIYNGNISINGTNVSKEGHTHTASQVSGLATVATSGSYDDLTDKPSIPAAVTVDSALSSTSTNPVQNKVINNALAGKAASTHTHSASDITSGTLAIARIPTGTSASTVALGNHTHSEYLPLNFSGRPQTITLTAPGDPYGTQSIRLETQNNVLKETFSRKSATLNVTYNLQGESSTSIEWAQGDNTIRFKLNNGSTITVDGNTVLTSGNYSQYISSTDTKNTTGTANLTSKLFLVGGPTQSGNGITTYSNINVYTQNGQLYATQMNATNGFYETSDARLKNFKDDINALDVVSKIPTKYFTWKKEEVTENIDPVLHIGTSAQEVQKIYPDLVTENEEGELSVDYARLSVIALAAIKELKKEIDELKSKN